MYIDPCAPCYDPCADPCYDPCYDPCAGYPIVVDDSECLPVYGAQPYGPQSAVAAAPRWVQPTPTRTNIPYPNGAYATGPNVGRGQHLAGLSLSPQRLIAPVGEEVALIAGLCGADGYLIKKEPIEWSLSPDSVGTLVEVDEFNKPLWRKLLHKYPEKRSGTYAVGRTSTAPQILTRGTLDPRDDIQLHEGQTWISVTSPNEGVSHVTAVAPTAVGWGERRQTATIHWVDGQWMFPPPAITAIGSPQTLTTKVVRSTDGSPVQGWIVRYEIVGGPAGSTGRQVVEVPTDANGNASVVVTPNSPEPGTSQVNAQVIRIGRSAGDIPRQTIGQGSTTVTWSGSAAPSSVPPATVPPSTLPPVTTPPTTTPPTSLPPASVPPTLTPANRSLKLSVDAPRTINADGSIPYRIRVENTGSEAVRDVEVYAFTPFGTEYQNSSPQAEDVGGRIRWRFAEIPAGQSQDLEANYKATGKGPIRYLVNANVGGDPTAEDYVDTAVVPSRPTAPANAESLEIDVSGPNSATVGQQVTHQITVTNRGTEPIRNVNLVDRFDAGLTHPKTVVDAF